MSLKLNFIRILTGQKMTFLRLTGSMELLEPVKTGALVCTMFVPFFHLALKIGYRGFIW